jgi:2-dehydro-3-deoxyphosphogluconate aldolase/(4S)-4-hydroxy-2-oxoglutarate aldolase
MLETSWLRGLRQQRAIAVIRTADFNLGKLMAKAVAKGGMRLIEITWNSDQAAALISQLRADLPECLIGAGTLLSIEDVNQAIAAGAEFLFTPHTQPLLIEMAQSQGIPIVPGALSPTEIVAAWQAGATCVKVFPIQSVGGANYIQSLQGPLSHIPLIPTGGLTLANARDFIQAGAIAVGLSGDLFPPEAIVAGNWDTIAQRTTLLLNSLAAP